LQQPKKRLCDPSTTNHCHRRAMKSLALANAPAISSRITHQATAKSKNHAESKLGHRFSEDTPRACPQSLVVDEVQICIHTRRCQLNPRRTRVLEKQRQLFRLITAPDDTIEATGCGKQVASASMNRQFGPLHRRSDVNSRR